MIKFVDVTKKYKNNTILSDISFEIEKGQLVVLIGLSGCGKTTTLKLINRMLDPTTGKVLIQNEDISKKDPIKLRRNIGYVIQQTGIFPHMTIRENIEIIPKAEKINKEDINKRTKELTEMFGIEDLLDRYPNELSGGQQQRVGVARAFALDPEIILMDEPFSALDPITRAGLQDELINIQAKHKKTIVFVTHDMSEAIKIADKICIMDKGKILQHDTPENILKHPNNQFVSEFIGQNSIWRTPEYIRANDIMHDDYIVCDKALTLEECIKMIESSNKEEMLVIDFHTKHLYGILYKDKVYKEKDLSLNVSRIMDTDFISVQPGDSITEILRHMNEKILSCIPVVENGILKGLITKHSLFITLSKQLLNSEEAI